jgi:hypothetical protein
MAHCMVRLEPYAMSGSMYGLVQAHCPVQTGLVQLSYLTRPLPPKAPPTALLALCSQDAGTFPLCSLPSSFLAPCTQSPHVHISLFLIQ